jgi:glycosyltransferase involved in cell wall biosynthesis
MAEWQKSNCMKKVLNIVPYPFLPYFSGGQKLIAQFNKHLAEVCELHVAGTANNDRYLATNYIFYPFLKKSRLRFFDITVFFRLRTLVKQKNIDTIIIEHPYLGWLAWLLKKTTNTRFIVHTHNIEYERFRTIGKPWWKILQQYETAVLRSADIVFCISDEDRQWMIERMQIPANKCILVPYGISNNTAPTDKLTCKQQVCATHQIDISKKILLFNGLLNYKPNSDALKVILEEINPRLQKTDFSYHILIAGKRLPDSLNNLKPWNNQGVTYVGFVDDIDFYIKAADILLNPVNSGGGVKTKMIEAIGLNTNVVATETGAIGIDKTICGNKLVIVQDEDWNEFAIAIHKAAMESSNTPSTFYQNYYWGYILKKTVRQLEEL